MGNGVSHLIPCLNPNPSGPHKHHHHHHHHGEVVVTTSDHQLQPPDETLGHSFRYVRSSARFLSPTPSDRFLSPNSQSFHFSDDRSRQFKAISGASVSANTSTPRTVLHLDSNDVSVSNNGDDSGNCTDLVYGSGSIVNGFDCTSSFFALPLQPLPRGESTSGFFLSGPIDAAGSLSGPLDSGSSDVSRVPFSAPLGGAGCSWKKKKKRSFSGIKRSFQRSFSEKKRPWVVPVGRKEGGETGAGAGVVVRENDGYGCCDGNVQWALGKAGEDRVHVVVSEEHGWLFVGIYDGFNGPDAPEFLMGHLYRAVFNELKGLFWDSEEGDDGNCTAQVSEFRQQEGEDVRVEVPASRGENEIVSECEDENRGCVKRVTFQSEQKETRRKLWEFLAENDAEDGLDLSGSDRFAFSVDDAVSVSNVGSAQSAVTRRSLLLSKLKQGLTRSKEGHSRSLFRWRFGVVDEKDKVDTVNRLEGENYSSRNDRRRKLGPVDHESVLRALSQALEKTEQAYLDLTEKVIDQYPELALMGSCLLVVLMRDEDVYVMNVGDSRAIVAQFESHEGCSNGGSKEVDGEPSGKGVVEEGITSGGTINAVVDEVSLRPMKLTALQLSTDHCTSIEQEVLRIKREHPNDNRCIVNDRVKGRLKVTRAFGAGFLKQPKFNESLLEMFRNEFIGNAPYISWMPSLRHHKLGSRDQFLVLSSDGLYQYLTNHEVVSYVDNFMEKFPDGDPAQHLIEELLNRAAKKAGMDFHELLDIPQGDRRKYHDDVTVMVISLEGRIWKSSGKYP